ncbi:hypothetical protein GDO86_009696 [Hymenochirus boettgeri]|uniref:G-protein coupled receptors family 3 profile domain-containing protein n=1 Tax=Hymenochirus boettgeri TaxID=247094 RepID=A0A8T2JK10_9PIPI|nr:hypothetical protein GDO86_009696 [Hymenochirus boettgeri]
MYKQLHNTYSEDFKCTGLRLEHTTDAMSMIHSIEKINNSTLLPGISLGYKIYDSCSSALKAVHATMMLIPEILSANNCTNISNSENIPAIKAIVGEMYSEISIAMSRILNIHSIPQISPASSAVTLSDKFKFPSFLRTIPSDVYQKQAIVKLISSFGWNWIGIIISDDDYGWSAVEHLNVFLKREGICVAFTKVMPTYIDHPDLSSSKTSILNLLINNSAHVVIVVVKSQIVINLFKECIKLNISKTWIASDIWATSNDVAEIENIERVGTILGVDFKRGHIPGFEEYLKNLKVPENGAVNEFIKEYKELRFGCTEDYIKYLECINSSSNYCAQPSSLDLKSPLACKFKDFSTADDDYLLQITQWRTEYSTSLAINAIAQALKNILCKNGTCKNDVNLSPRKLLNELKMGKYSFNGDTFFFNPSGDVHTDYDIIYWEMTKSSTVFQTIGVYHINSSSVNIQKDKITWYTFDNQVPFSNCSKTCLPGSYKKHSDITCCYKCIECPGGYYTPKADMNECLKCPVYQWSNNESSYCTNRTTEYFEWNNPYAVTLMTFAALAILLVLLVVILLIKYRDTPAVKAAGGNYTYLLAASVLLSLVSTMFFIGHPTDIICQIRQPLYGISFTICVSCILIKSLRIVLAFESGKRGHKVLTYHPIIIISILTFFQICVCVLWLIFKCPFVDKIYPMPHLQLLQCNEGSYVAFGVMLGYIGFLAFICFILAYKGRKLPEKYNEARCITFSMLIYMFVWIAFIPIYMYASGIYVSAVQVFAILASIYGVISCHLLPVSYIVLFKRKSNSRERYLNSIREFWNKKPKFSHSKMFHFCPSQSLVRKRHRSY